MKKCGDISQMPRNKQEKSSLQGTTYLQSEFLKHTDFKEKNTVDPQIVASVLDVPSPPISVSKLSCRRQTLVLKGLLSEQVEVQKVTFSNLGQPAFPGDTTGSGARASSPTNPAHATVAREPSHPWAAGTQSSAAQKLSTLRGVGL